MTPEDYLNSLADGSASKLWVEQCKRLGHPKVLARSGRRVRWCLRCRTELTPEEYAALPEGVVR